MPDESNPNFRGFSQESWPAVTLTAADHLGAVVAFSMRSGGYSPPPFDSLNFSTMEGDSPDNVDRNLRVFTEAVDIDPGRIVFAHQRHEDRIHVVNSARVSSQEADALIAAKTGIILAIKTADCVPILLLDPAREIAAAVHAGWKGTVLRISRKVVSRLKHEFGSRAEDLLVALGPVIGQCCYAVDDSVLVPFRNAIPSAERFVVTDGRPTPQAVTVTDNRSKADDCPQECPGKEGGLRKGSTTCGEPHVIHRLDLLGANRYELISEGVRPSNIFEVGLCTACNPHLFFSHRRDRGRTGRHIAVVGFRGER